MNYLDVNKQTANSLSRRQQALSFGNGWEASGRQITALAVDTSDIDGHEDSFASQSKILPVLLKSVAAKDMSIMDLITLVQSAKAIEEGDTKAAAFVRDTSGGKPVERKQDLPTSPLQDLTDEQLEFIEQNAEVIDEQD